MNGFSIERNERLQNLLYSFIIFGASLIVSCSYCIFSPSVDFYANNVDKEFLFRPRVYIWLRKISFVSVMLLVILRLVFGNLQLLEEEIIPDFDMSELIVSCSVLLSLTLDGLNNQYYTKRKISWFVVYLVTCGYFYNQYFRDYSLMNIVILIAYIFGITMTAIEILYSKANVQAQRLTKEFTCDLLEYITFSYLNDILINPMQTKVMDFDDVPTIVDSDTSSYCWNSMNSVKSATLGWRLLYLIRWDWIQQGFFQLLGLLSTYMAPIAMQVILAFVHDGKIVQQSTILPIKINVFVALVLLISGPFIKYVSEGQNYLRAQRSCMRVRSGIITTIYEKALSIDLTAYSEGPGRINNLISVDIRSIEDLYRYSHWCWSFTCDILISMFLLFLILGMSAIWGILVMVSTIAIGFVLSNFLSKYQDEILKRKDSRMSIVNEVLNGIRIIKLFAWEENIMSKVSIARKYEVNYLKKWAYTNCISKTIWSLAPTAVAFVAFLIHIYVYGRKLDASTGYAALTIFNSLRFPLRSLPELVNLIVSCRISLNRIQSFLSVDNQIGIKRQSMIDESVVSISNASFAWRTKPVPDNVKNDLIDRISEHFRRIFRIISRGLWYFKDRPILPTEHSYQEVNKDDLDDHFEMSLNVGQYDQNSRSGQYLQDSSSIAIAPDSEVCGYRIILENINISIQQGSLTVIVGPTGCGKSTLLAGLLGQCLHLQGLISVNPNIQLSYVPQSSWIQNGTLRDNILFGGEFNHERYWKVIKSCSLDEDIKLFELGDDTEIGEKGVSLSGGQQQRVSLARAAYSFSDLIVMDDPLSAVDSSVGKHIFDNLICGFLSDRTRILVTHQISLAMPKADYVVCMDSNGYIIANSSPKHLKESTTSSIVVATNESLANRLLNNSTGLKTKPSFSFLNTVVSALDSAPNDDGQFTNNHQNIKEDLSAIPIEALSNTPSSSHKGKIIEAEGKRFGEVPLSVYWFYLKACGGKSAVSALFVASIAMVLFTTLQSWGVGMWITSLESGDSVKIQRSFIIYLVFIGCLVIATISRSFMEAIFSCRGAQNLHDNAFVHVLEATCSWYDSTPIGRIINRLSQDVSTIDKDIMPNLSVFFDCICGIFQMSFIIAFTIPWLLPLVIPVVVATVFIASKYLRVAREIKRLESVSKSPVFVLFSETIQGLSVIRVFQHEQRFMKICFDRVNNMSRCFLYLWLSNRWLNLRMQFMGLIVFGLVAIGVVCRAKYLDSTTAGILLVYCLEFTNNLVWLARSHADVQMNLNSVERIQEYTTIPSEKYCKERYFDTLLNPSEQSKERGVPSKWPTRGELEFKAIYLRYNSSSEYVLRQVQSGKKVGVIGRSGAGKSSLLASLFRLVEPTSGELLIDGINILTLPLHTLRSRIAIVPQEPTLFQGSIRSNLDPFGAATDDMIWKTLAQVKLDDHVRSLPGHTLEDKIVSEKGSNFSVGQRQLLCLARALLRHSPILVLDECTANVDHETDRLIQDTIRNELHNITVLCIAHRLHTVAYYDKIIVMDKGTVAEMGSPLELIENETSRFRIMCEKTGDFDNIISTIMSSVK